jgi:hypothetical protein
METTLCLKLFQIGKQTRNQFNSKLTAISHIISPERFYKHFTTPAKASVKYVYATNTIRFDLFIVIKLLLLPDSPFTTTPTHTLDMSQNEMTLSHRDSHQSVLGGNTKLYYI